MLNEIDKYHLKLMKERILGFQVNEANLDSLLSITRSLEELMNALKNVDKQFKDDLTTEWWELELLSSVMMTEEEEEPLDKESKQNIVLALENMKEMIDAVLDNRVYFRQNNNRIK